MKNILKITLLVFLFSIWITFAQQGNLTDWIDDLNDETLFWYTIAQKVSIKEITTQKVVIESPIIMDDFNTKITKYTVMYSEHTLDQMLNDTNLLNQAKEKTYDYTGNDSKFTIELWLYDMIDPSKVYYVIIMPKDSAWIWWQISNEIRFKMSNQTSGEWVYIEPIQHAAAWWNMALANITHTCVPDCLAPGWDSKKISLKRISVIWSDIVDIYLSNDGTTNFNKLATTNMSSEQYELATTKNGEHVFKFTPNNWWTEYTYTVNIAWISVAPTTPWTTTPWITKVPKTWPTENTIVAILITLGVYFAYRRLYRKN